MFGLVSHGIRRTSAPQEDGSVVVKWKMVEKLAGAVPCSDRRHTGEHIGELSNAAWAASGIVKPTEDMKEEMLEILMWARINKEKRQRA